VNYLAVNRDLVNSENPRGEMRPPEKLGVGKGGEPNYLHPLN